MLAYYSGRLNGVELNGSFYRMPPAETLAGWAAQAPENFRFCFKAHRGLTYSGDAFDRNGLAGQVGLRLRQLGPRLGPILLQFPPTRTRDLELLSSLLGALDLPAAAEFRHESWFSEDVYGVLHGHGAALVVTDQEKWPEAPRLRLSNFSYYRLRRDYDAQELERWRAELQEESSVQEAVYVYFRHDPSAPAWAARILER